MLKFILILYLFFPFARADETYLVPNWKFHFVPGTGMGMFMAIALPLDIPHKNVFFSYNFEANYNDPGNETYYEYPPLITRGIDRALVYNALEAKMRSNGYPGKECLLRTICESAKRSINHVNGILGDLMHIVFTPSTSLNGGDLDKEYEEAEQRGNNNDCTDYNKKCSVSFLDLISWIGPSV